MGTKRSCRPRQKGACVVGPCPTCFSGDVFVLRSPKPQTILVFSLITSVGSVLPFSDVFRYFTKDVGLRTGMWKLMTYTAPFSTNAGSLALAALRIPPTKQPHAFFFRLSSDSDTHE